MKSRTNWNRELQHTLATFSEKPKLILHSCCAPCSSHVINFLNDKCDILVYYYNPNIFPEDEYQKRLDEQKRLLEILKIPFIESIYEPSEFEKIAFGYENECEGGRRCEQCFTLRLNATAKAAKEANADLFGTTLSVSPHKNADLINQILIDTGNNHGVMPLLADFKKNNGYHESIRLSREYKLYRQSYCGCRFSMERH